MKTRIGIALAALLALTTDPAFATDGYFQLGYGTAQNGMAGASAALSLNTMSPATNPASNAWVTGYDLNLAAFNPNREFTVTGSPSGFPGTFGLQPGTVKSGNSLFFVPGLGANWQLNPTMTLGVALYGNGGMNTAYDASVFYAGRAGVDLSQLFVVPTFTIKVANDHAFGVSPILAYQRFQAEGVSSFAPFSSDAANLSNRGHDSSLGFGARFGYLGHLTPWLSFGAAYQTETKMGKFDSYAGLFAEQGGFNIPSNWTIGVALKPAPSFTVAFDVQEIYYSQVKSIANPILPNLGMVHLGNDGGAGFGWQNVTAYKLGLQWATNPNLTFRMGYAWANQPIPESEVLFNILAPGVIEQHLTAGVSGKVGAKSTLNFSVVKAFSKSVTGPNPLEVPGKQTIELKMDQWIFDLGFSVGF